MASCARTAVVNQCVLAWRVLPAMSNRATAPNESQNPADRGAQGSSRQTRPSAIANTREPAPNQPRQIAQAATPIMYRVRCAGTPQPASMQ